MSDAVSAVNYILSQSGAVIARVPAASILSVATIPVETDKPVIGVKQIDGDEFKTVAMSEAKKFSEDLVQVTVRTDNEADKRAILQLAHAALRGQSGSFSGVWVDSITPDGIGPDLDDPGAQIYEQSRRYRVKWSA